MNQSKQELRQQALRHRQHMRLDDEEPAEVISYFYELCSPLVDREVALYWPKTHEFDTTPLIMELVRNGVTCGLPITYKGSRELAFAYWDENTPLERGRYDVQHPKIDADTYWLDPDIVVVPMLAFDQRGFRLGFGGGYYDATLNKLRAKKPVSAIGVAYAQQACLFPLPSEPHDEQLDYVITPKGIRSFVERKENA